MPEANPFQSSSLSLSCCVFCVFHFFGIEHSLLRPSSLQGLTILRLPVVCQKGKVTERGSLILRLQFILLFRDLASSPCSLWKGYMLWSLLISSGTAFSSLTSWKTGFPLFRISSFRTTLRLTALLAVPEHSRPSALNLGLQQVPDCPA